MDKNVALFLKKAKSVDGRIKAIYLFGSQARGTAHAESDYDFLLVVEQKNKELKGKLYDIAVDIFLKTGADISLKILRCEDFERLSSLRAPFIENILKEGIKFV